MLSVMPFDLSPNQKTQFYRNMKKGRGMSLKFKPEQINKGLDRLTINETQKEHLLKNRAKGKGAMLKLTPRQMLVNGLENTPRISHNPNGGVVETLIPALVSVASGIIGDLGSRAVDKLDNELSKPGNTSSIAQINAILESTLDDVETQLSDAGIYNRQDTIREIRENKELSLDSIDDTVNSFIDNDGMDNMGMDDKPISRRRKKGKGLSPSGYGLRPLGQGLRPMGLKKR